MIWITTTYASPLQLVRFLNIEGTVLSREAIGTARPDETIGTGNGTVTKFYLDNAYIVSATYSFRYSAAEATAGTALTETTHYVLDKDDGTLTLTAAGVTAVGTDNIYGDYSYNKLALTDTQIQEALDRAQSEIDDTTNSHFATATDTTPDYIQLTNEKHDGKGRYDRAYFTLKYPLPTVSTTVSGTAVTAADTTVYVDDSTGFLDTGIIGIGNDKITYTGKSGSAFTGCTGVVSGHATAINVRPYILEVSTTAGGSVPTYQILTEDSEFDIDKDTGRIWIFNQGYFIDEFGHTNPPRLKPNRFRVTYYYGHDTIPAEITRCCLMIAAKDLIHTTVRRNYVDGSNEFNPELVNIDDEWIKSTIQSYSSIQSANIWGYWLIKSEDYVKNGKTKL